MDFTDVTDTTDTVILIVLLHMHVLHIYYIIQEQVSTSEPIIICFSFSEKTDKKEQQLQQQ